MVWTWRPCPDHVNQSPLNTMHVKNKACKIALLEQSVKHDDSNIAMDLCISRAIQTRFIDSNAFYFYRLTSFQRNNIESIFTERVTID